MGVGSTIAGVVGSVLSGAAGLYGAEKEREEQRYLQERAFEMDIQKWNMMKDYEAPAAQMERFKKAGLNPDLIYGQQSGSPSMPESKPPDAPNIASAYTSAAGNAADALLIGSQIDKNRADARNADSQADLAGGRNSREEATLPLLLGEIASRMNLNQEEAKKSQEQQKLIVQKVNESCAMVDNLRSQAEFYDSQTSINEVKLKYADEYYSESVNQLKSQIKLNDAQSTYLNAQEERLKKSLNAYISLLKAQARESNASADLDEQEKKFRDTKVKYGDKVYTYNQLRVLMLTKQAELLKMQIQYYPAEVMNGLLARKAAVVKDIAENETKASQTKSTAISGDKTVGQRYRDLSTYDSYEQYMVSYCKLIDEYIKMVGQPSGYESDIVE